MFACVCLRVCTKRDTLFLSLRVCVFFLFFRDGTMQRLPSVPPGLELAYITPRIIAMGAPYDDPPLGRGRRSARNPARAVAALLAARHPPPHCRIYDLTLDDAYTALTFLPHTPRRRRDPTGGPSGLSASAATSAAATATPHSSSPATATRRAAAVQGSVPEIGVQMTPAEVAALDAEAGVVRCGWPDFHAPTVDALGEIAWDAQRFLARDARNVAVFHCKAGRARTCTAVTALRLRTGECADVAAAVADFERRRGKTGCGGCQRAALHAYAAHLRRALHTPPGRAAPAPPHPDPRTPRTPLVLESVTLRHAPRTCPSGPRGAPRPYAPIVELRTLGSFKPCADRVFPAGTAAGTVVPERDGNGGGGVRITVPVGELVAGDVLVTVADAHQPRLHAQHSRATRCVTNYGRRDAFRLALHTHYVARYQPHRVPFALLDGELVEFSSRGVFAPDRFAVELRFCTPSAYLFGRTPAGVPRRDAIDAAVAAAAAQAAPQQKAGADAHDETRPGVPCVYPRLRV